MTGKDVAMGAEKANEKPVDYQEPNLSNWQLNGNRLTHASMVINPTSSSMVDASVCPSDSMAGSFCPTIWNQPISGQDIGYSDRNLQSNASTSNALGNETSSFGPVRPSVDWALPNRNATLSEQAFLPDFPEMVNSSLPHLPADSGFIERAARFSCFGGGNSINLMSPFRLSECMNPYTRDLTLEGPCKVLTGNGSNSLPMVQSQMHKVNSVQSSKKTSLPMHETEGSPLKNNKMKTENFSSSHDEAKYGTRVPVNESDEAEISGSGFQEELKDLAGGSCELGSKKRKRTGQDAQLIADNGGQERATETANDCPETQQQGDQNLASTKPGGKPDKSQGSDPHKEEYIHVRARRGQATNSHSLAERVRREKISERMKLLQDLVPGCSKVTGKAVMLDEIINYVQSLQQQVEFLSMKLATVNPRLDYSIEELLAKDPRAATPSSLAFLSNINKPHLPLHQLLQTGIFQQGLPGLGSSSGSLLGSINSQFSTVGGRCKESTSQAHCIWEDELHNIIQMGFTSSDPVNSQNLRDSPPRGHTETHPR